MSPLSPSSPTSGYVSEYPPSTESTLTVSIVAVLLIWLSLFMILPLKSQGPTFGVCHSAGAACTIRSTTDWHWFGGYHAIFSGQEANYPAVMKYQPTSTEGVWTVLLLSLALAMLSGFYIKNLPIHSSKTRKS